MKKVYVTRGLGFNDNEVWMGDFKSTMLRESGYEIGSWFSAEDWDDGTANWTYQGFHDLTGIELAPGEYTLIELGTL